MEYKGLPLFNLDVVEGLPGIELISLVDDPAVEREFIKFNAEHEIKLALNEEKRIVTGVALIPGQKIYREDRSGKYYITFTKEAVERTAIKFFADRHSADANLMHEVDADGIVYFESYLMNHERGIVPAEFADLPDGTWIVSAKILNDDVWMLIKQGVLRGFSVEGRMGVIKDKPIESVEELIDYINKFK